MSSLYEISKDLMAIFTTIEDNDGEITDEQFDALTIKQEELNTKLNSYVKAIREFQKDDDFCKDEKKAINDRQTIYKNRVERLKKAALEAVLAFGERGKSGNMFIELPTNKLFTKRVKSIKPNDYRINVLISELDRYIRELVSQGILYTGEDVDLEGLIESINANVKAEYGDDFVPFTTCDLETLIVNVSFTGSVADFFRRYGDVLNTTFNYPNVAMENITTKDDYKKSIELSNEGIRDFYTTLADEVYEDTLQIK